MNKLLKKLFDDGQEILHSPITIVLVFYGFVGAVVLIVSLLTRIGHADRDEELRLTAVKIASGGLWQVVRSENTGDSLTGWRFVLARNGYGEEDPMVYAVDYVNRACPYYNEWVRLGWGEFIRLESAEPLKDAAYDPLGALDWLRPHSLTKPYSGGMIAGL